MRGIGAAALLALAMALGACDYPRDARGTLDRVEGGHLRVGVVEDPPWAAFAEARPVGIEVELVRRFANRLDAHVHWRRGAEHDLMGALRRGEVDLVVGGLTRETPWRKHVALTRPYVTTQLVVGTLDGVAREDARGVPVAVEADTAAAGLLREKTDAELVELPRLPRAPSAAATDRFLLPDLGLVSTGLELARERHVMAVRRGESGFLVRLERFLLGSGDLVARLQEAARP